MDNTEPCRQCEVLADVLRRLIEEGFTERAGRPGQFSLDAEVFDTELQSMELGVADCLPPLNELLVEATTILDAFVASENDGLDEGLDEEEL